jgi:hypothetical protein
VDAVYQGSPAGHGEGDVEVQAGASNTVHITMIPTDEFASPVITREPQGTTVLRNIGSAAVSLDVEAMSFFQGALSYQWYRNTIAATSGGNPIPGEINPAYTPAHRNFGYGVLLCGDYRVG